MSDVSYLRVRNWDRFRYRKDRALPWIRVHVTLLEAYEYTQLSDAARGHLLGIWLLGKRLKNKIPNDAEWVRQAIVSNRKPDLEAFLEWGFLEPWLDEEAETEPPRNDDTADQDATLACTGRTLYVLEGVQTGSDVAARLQALKAMRRRSAE